MEGRDGKIEIYNWEDGEPRFCSMVALISSALQIGSANSRQLKAVS